MAKERKRLIAHPSAGKNAPVTPDKEVVAIQQRLGNPTTIDALLVALQGKPDEISQMTDNDKTNTVILAYKLNRGPRLRLPLTEDQIRKEIIAILSKKTA